MKLFFRRWNVFVVVERRKVTKKIQREVTYFFLAKENILINFHTLHENV